MPILATFHPLDQAPHVLQTGERALAAAIKPFRDRTGAVSIRNVFRYVVAVKA